MRSWTTSLLLALVAGCSSTHPTKPVASAEAPAAAFDVNALPASQRKGVLDWVDYICSLPPEKRTEAMHAAPAGYALITADGQPISSSPSDGPTIAFTCPH